ncbi:MAG: hypothetical protein IJ652_04780 [Bacteroidales bacterium]|nr:hypothetical protein [Bacteroidales bacterium]
MKPEPQNTTKQQIAAKWKAYEEAEKADRPQLQAELLQDIRDLAIQEHIPIDFYNASVRYITVKERRNWKDRDSVRREFSRLVRAFDEPIVTYKWMRNYGNYRTDRLLEYIQEDASRFQGKHNPAFYSIGALGGELKKHFADDYEFVLWDMLQSRSFDALHPEKDAVYAALDGYITCEYPSRGYLQYLVAKKLSESEGRKARMEELSARWSGKALWFYPQSDLIRMEESRLSREKGSSAEYKALYDRCLRYEEARKALKPASEANIARDCTYPKDLASNLSSKNLSLSAGGDSVAVRFQNLDQAKVTMYKVENGNRAGKVRSWNIRNTRCSFFVNDTEKFALPLLDDGEYALEAKSGKKYETSIRYNQFTLSLAKRSDADGHRVYVTEFVSGKPIPSARFVLVEAGRTLLSQEVKLDGFTLLPEAFQLKLDRDSDNYRYLYCVWKDEQGVTRRSQDLSVSFPWRRYAPYKDLSIQGGCRILRDRGAYNPGDELQYKVILFRGNYVDRMAVEPDAEIEVVLRNAESKEIERKKLTTNEFGSAAGSLTLPVDQKNGMFSLSVYQGTSLMAREFFRVDEFVLPTFGLTFDPQEELYLPGSKVIGSGKVFSYSGHSLTGATIKLIVKRYSTAVYETVLSPASDGSFLFHFPAQESGLYQVDALVSDATGQTQEFTNYYYISNKISVDVAPLDATGGEFSEITEKGSPRPYYIPGRRDSYHGYSRAIVTARTASFSLTVRDADGNAVPNAVRYKLQNEAKQVLQTGEAASGDAVTIDLGALPAGLYVLEAEAKVEGSTVQGYGTCKILYIPENELAGSVRRVFIPGETQVRPGEDIRLRFGSADGPTWAVVTLFGDKRQVLETRKLYLGGTPGPDGTMTTLTFPYRDEYPDAVRLSVFYFKYGETIDYTEQYTRKRTVLDLPLRVSAYTNPALPATQYTVTLDTAPETEALAAVYDKSIDAIAKNNWAPVYLQGFSAEGIDLDSTTGYITGLDPETRKVTLQSQEFYASAESAVMMKGSNLVLMREAPMALGAPVMEESVTMDSLSDAESAEADAAVPIRSKFETALTFQPFLRADAQGRISFTFGTSDKLSTYYIHVYAHDKQMRNAIAREEFQVTIPVKVSLLDPGYLYEGDELRPSVSVSSSASEPISGKLWLYVYPGGDYTSLKPLSSQSVALTVPAGGEVAASFRVPAKGASVGLKAVFVADRYSDAVFVEVPVRSRAQTLTESHSAVLLPGMDEKATLDRLRKAFVNVKGSKAEYSEIMVMDLVSAAIPQKLEPAGRDVLSLSEAYYMRLLSAQLKDEQDPAEDLLEKIMACQGSDGGFAWFEGMTSSRMITAVILERFCRLADRGFSVPDLSAAVRYLDKTHFDRKLPTWCGWISDAQYMYIRSFYPDVPFEVKGDAKLLKEFKKEAADYLVPSAKDGRGLTGRILDKARRLRTLHNLSASAAGRSLAASWGVNLLTATRLEASRKADIQSLVEYAVPHPDGGCYYPNAVMPWRGLLESEAYAHALLADLMEVSGEEKLADDVRLWLLLQKETQHWDAEPAFVDALSSIMSASAEVLYTKVMVLRATYTKPYVEIKAAGNGFTVERRFYRLQTVEERYNDTTEEQNRMVQERVEIRPGEVLHRGEKIEAEYRIWNQENRSFVRLNAHREATLRPADQLSGYYGWHLRPFYIDGLSISPQGYREVKADRTLYWFDSYPEENTTVRETFFVTQDGTFTAPVIEIESLYAPHYRANAGFTKPLRVE